MLYGYDELGEVEVDEAPENRAVVTGFLVAGVFALFFWALARGVRNGA